MKVDTKVNSKATAELNEKVKEELQIPDPKQVDASELVQKGKEDK